jgi:hypothetical protein
MRKIVINKSYEPFCVSHKALLRLRELGQEQATQETDLGAYWPKAARPREPSLNQYGVLIPRDTRSSCAWWRNSARRQTVMVRS